MTPSLKLPVIAAPMFIVSTPALVIAQCKAGVVGSFPALNARERDGEPPLLEAWLAEITAALAAHDAAHPERPAAPFAVNQIVHRSNTRLERDIEICARWKVPIWITSMGARPELNEAAHAVGATVFHDVIHDTHARKAIEKGADGLVAVAAGAGGHAGAQSPFALVAEIRRWFDGPLALSGAIATGAAILAAEALGADYAYVGSAFIATREANADDAYKAMIVEGTAQDILYTKVFSGVPANYLRASIVRQGLDPDDLAPREASIAGAGDGPRPWRDIWGAGRGARGTGSARCARWCRSRSWSAGSSASIAPRGGGWASPRWPWRKPALCTTRGRTHAAVTSRRGGAGPPSAAPGQGGRRSVGRLSGANRAPSASRARRWWSRLSSRRARSDAAAGSKAASPR